MVHINPDEHASGVHLMHTMHDTTDAVCAVPRRMAARILSGAPVTWAEQ
jgi:hypothetical protein